MYLKVSEAAKKANVHPNTIRRWLIEGTLKGAKLPTSKYDHARWSIPEKELNAFLEGMPCGKDTKE
jgi:excisionase family DNA binding protein